MNIKENFFPKTRIGKWSMGFGIAFLSFYLFSSVIVGFNQLSGNSQAIDTTARPFLIASGVLFMASGLAAFFTGLVSVTKYHERTLAVCIATFLGFLALLFVLGELLIPH